MKKFSFVLISIILVLFVLIIALIGHSDKSSHLLGEWYLETLTINDEIIEEANGVIWKINDNNIEVKVKDNRIEVFDYKMNEKNQIEISYKDMIFAFDHKINNKQLILSKSYGKDIYVFSKVE